MTLLFAISPKGESQTDTVVHFVELVNRIGPDRPEMLTSEVLPLVWQLLREIQSNRISSVGQLRQPTAELVECISAQLDDDIRAFAREPLSRHTCQLLDELMSNLQ